MLQTIKFSEFISAGNLANNNTTVGIASGDNAQFNNPWTFLPPGSTADRPTPSPSIYYLLRLNTDLQLYEYYNPITVSWIQLGTYETQPWVAANTTPISMAVNTGYYVTSPIQVTFTLPSISAASSIIKIVGNGAGGWVLKPSVGQTIEVIDNTATTSITTAEQYDCIEVFCTVANMTWVTRSFTTTGFAIV